jgi:hypothetical protein
MAAFDYSRMQATATRLLDRFQQGTVLLRRITLSAGPNAWTPGGSSSEEWPLKATVRRVSQKYVDGVTILATDNQITFSVPDVTPLLTDRLVIDGDEQVMKDLRPIPAAGVVVAYMAFVAG